MPSLKATPPTSFENASSNTGPSVLSGPSLTGDQNDTRSNDFDRIVADAKASMATNAASR